MDRFAQFNFLLVDASDGAPGAAKILVRDLDRRERIDLISRQFHEFLNEVNSGGETARGILLTRDFKLRHDVNGAAGWVAFLVDHGNGATEELEEVARVFFARGPDERQRVLRQLARYADGNLIPPAPVVVAVGLVPRRQIPSAVSEWYGKSVAAFLAPDIPAG